MAFRLSFSPTNQINQSNEKPSLTEAPFLGTKPGFHVLPRPHQDQSSDLIPRLVDVPAI
jgi:hypothetical protein